MKTLIILGSLILALSGCAVDRDADRPIMKFYREAKQRQIDPNQSIALNGLKWNFGVLPKSRVTETYEQSSLIVTDPNPEETHAVQLIVEPRVSGSFLDPVEPSLEFLRQQAMDIESALKTHRYVNVYLLPK